MDNRILVAYASKAGSTAEIAAHIGETLSKHNLSVDVQPAAKVTDLTPYRGVILGSSIRAGRLLPDAMAFLEKNQAALQQKPFGVFIACLTMMKEDEESRKAASAYLEPVRALVKPTSEGLFAGAFDPNKLGLVERLIMKAMKSPQGDFRRWDQISAWAESVSSL